MNSIVLTIALRHLRSGVRQSLLTIGVVAISVTVMVVLGGLIDAMQRRLITSITGAIAHVSIQQGPRTPVLVQLDSHALIVERVVPIENTQRKIEDWQQLVDTLPARAAGVIAVSPTIDGQGYLIRGERRKAVTITGMIPERHNHVVELANKLVSGRFFGLSSGEMVLGIRLAADLRLKVGDKIRLSGTVVGSVGFTVAGIVDSGFRNLDDGAALIGLRDAQSLFGLGNAVTSIGMKLSDIYRADQVANTLSGQVPYEVRSWMRDNQSLLAGLRAQSIFSTMIRLSTVIAAGFSIASILFMSVTSKRREIGILKAIGATRRQIAGIFAIEGTLIGIVGATVGTAVGIGIAKWMTTIMIVSQFSGRLEGMFPIHLTLEMVAIPALIAVVIGLLAALYPARQASIVNPIDVIRSQ